MARKALGFRYLLRVIPLDASLVCGSHGLPAARPEDRPVTSERLVNGYVRDC